MLYPILQILQSIHHTGGLWYPHWNQSSNAVILYISAQLFLLCLLVCKFHGTFLHISKEHRWKTIWTHIPLDFSAIEKMFWELPVLRGLPALWVTCTESAFLYITWIAFEDCGTLHYENLIFIILKHSMHNQKNRKMIHTTTFSK